MYLEIINKGLPLSQLPLSCQVINEAFLRPKIAGHSVCIHYISDHRGTMEREAQTIARASKQSIQKKT